MKASAINKSTFRLRAAGSTADVPATVTVNAAFFFNDTATTEIYTLSLHDALPISAAVTDTIGTALGADSLWSFTTDVAPTVTAQAPAPGATGVPLNTTRTATFSKAMNAASITTSTFRLRAAGSTADVPATVTVNTAGTLFFFNDTATTEIYTLSLHDALPILTDTIGTALGADSLWSFTTDVAPTVTAQAPAPGATG